VVKILGNMSRDSVTYSATKKRSSVEEEQPNWKLKIRFRINDLLDPM